MSKKKATMTLKDFHGGSIPSDLPLPSAPGVTVRPVDRGAFDRQMSWGSSSVGRSDHRLRPASAGSVRNLDEKTPFLSNNPNIGRNFDEDERKPLDAAASGPRRIVSDESPSAQISRMVEPKVDARAGGRTASIPASQISGGSSGSSYAGRVNEVPNSRLNNHSFSGNRSYGSNYPVMSGNSGQVVGGSYPNAWGVRKEAVGMKEPVSAPWSAPDAATKLAHASPLMQISRWNSKQHVQTVKDADVESEYNGNKKTYNRLELQQGVGSDHNDVAPMMHAERNPSVGDGVRGGGKDMSSYERPRSTSHLESKERNTSFSGKSGGTGSEFQPILPSETSERPKLKLLPRTKPLETLEAPVDYKQGYEQTSAPSPHVEDIYVVHEPKNHVQSGVGGSVGGDRGPERPKLNLKPRSQPIEHRPQQLDGNDPGKRGTVFGGARPREVVLKERGVEDDVSSHDSRSPMRVKENAPKVDTSTHVADQKIPKQSDRRDQHMGGESSDPIRRNRQSEVWRNNNKDIDKNRTQPQRRQPQQHDRAQSPETWRRPAVQEPPALRYGKGASPIDLALTFSKSMSDPTAADRFSGSRGVPNRSQVPFSRLTGPTPTPQINGY